MNIRIIAEGSKKSEYKNGKWGLSLLIDEDILFDTYCDPDLLKSNFRKYNIDPGRLKHVVISHEHWDHIGGLPWILEENRDITVYVCSGFSTGFKEKIRNSGGRLIEITEFVRIKEEIYTTGEITCIYKNKSISEQSLIIKQEDKLALVTGCSHPGILKILTHTGLIFKEQIDLLLGGLHLMNASGEEIKNITTELDSSYRIKNIVPLHCSGRRIKKYLKKSKGRKYRDVSCGQSFHFNAERSSWDFTV